MPYQPARACAKPGCPHVLTHTTPACPVHGAPPTGYRWGKTGPQPPRMRGHALQRARLALFAREPLCRPCSEAGRVALASIRDHIINLASGGVDDDSNDQPICAECHAAKVQAESMQGKERAT